MKVKDISFSNGQFIVCHPTSTNEVYDSAEELFAAYPGEIKTLVAKILGYDGIEWDDDNQCFSALTDDKPLFVGWEPHDLVEILYRTNE